jgi:hypothetical protein
VRRGKGAGFAEELGGKVGESNGWRYRVQAKMNSFRLVFSGR